MLYTAMEAALRRKLSDVPEDIYTDAVIQEYLNQGISALQSFIHAINPTAFITTTTFATVAGTDLYAKTSSAFRVLRLEMLNTDGTYSKVPLRNFHDLVEVTSAFTESSVAAADLGNKWLIRPTPDAIKTIRVWYVPALTSSSTWDAQVLQLPEIFHTVAVDYAYVEAMGEGVDAPGVKEARQRIQEKLALLPDFYGRNSEQGAAMPINPFSSVGD